MINIPRLTYDQFTDILADHIMLEHYEWCNKYDIRIYETEQKNPLLKRDLKVIEFDTENITIEHRPNTLIGTFMIEGIPFVGCEAGGDWEVPVFFIFYWDGKYLRAYFPDRGNTYNRQEMCAYGSEPSGNCPINEDDLGTMDCDWDLVRQDILENFRVV